MGMRANPILVYCFPQLNVSPGSCCCDPVNQVKARLETLLVSSPSRQIIIPGGHMTKLCLNIEHLRQPDIHKSDESITFSNIHFLCFRYSEGQCWHPQQLQLVSHQEHPVGRDHHRCSEFSSPEQICLRLQLQRTGERLYSVSRVLRGEIIFCEIILLSQC